LARAKKPRWLGTALWGVALLLLTAGGLYWYQTKSAASAQTRYETATITRGDVRSRITATGNLQAVTQITVGSQVSGIIQSLFVDFNSRVRKGQALAQLDPSTIRAQVEQATASVNNALSALNNQQANVGNQAANVRSAEAAIVSAQAKVEAARGQLENARAGVVTAQANLRRGQADLKLAQRNESRQRELRERDLIATSELDTARTSTLTNEATVESLRSQVNAAEAGYRSAQANVQSAQAEVEAARMRADAARQQLSSSRAQVQGAMAQVSQAQANLRQAQVNLGFTTIRSPIDGIVLDRKVTLGQTVAAQFQAPDLFTLAQNLKQIQVQTNVDEADIGQVKPGAQATFTVDAFPERRFRGTVSEVRQAPVTVQNVVTYVVIVRTVNEDEKLKPGMTATVNIEVDSREDVLLVPNGALRFRPPEAGAPGERRRRRGGGNASPTPGASATPFGGEKPGRGERPRVRRVSVWTQDAKDPKKLVEHRVLPGITDGVNTELVESDLKEGQSVVVGSTGGDAPAAGNRSGGAGGMGGGRRGGPMRMF
jgi:HlyD family secretion protein